MIYRSQSTPHYPEYLLNSCMIYRSQSTPHYPEYLLNPRLEVLDLQLKHDHALLGLGDVLHPVVVGSALNMDELALMAFSGGDLHSLKGGVVVASSHLALALVGEVFNGEASVSREVCEPILQSLLIGGIATPAVDVDIVGGVSALSFDVLLNFREARTLRIVALRLLSGAIVGLWRPAPDCVQLDEDAGLNLVALLLGDEAVVVVLVALAQLGKVEGGVALHVVCSSHLPLAHVLIGVDLEELVRPGNVVSIEVALAFVLAHVNVGVALLQHEHLRVDPSVRVPGSQAHAWIHSDDGVCLLPFWSVHVLRQGGKEDVHAGDPESGKAAVVDAVEDGDLEP